MKVIDLMQLLEGADAEAEVRLMSQPSWPFEYSVLGTWSPPKSEDAPDACGDCGLPEKALCHAEPIITDNYGHEFAPYDPDAFEPNGGGSVVYIVEGTQLAYGTTAAWDKVERGY